MPPAVSVLCSTFRPGGIDVFLAGMRDQTFTDFEVILVDRRYERRRAGVASLAQAYGVPLLHVPEHRRNGKWSLVATAWNTALALAQGEYVIFLQDYAYAPPGWIEAHLIAQEGRPDRYVVAPYSYHRLPERDLRLLQPFDFSGQRERSRNCVEPDAMLEGGVLEEVLSFEGFHPSWFAREPLPPPYQDARKSGPAAGVPTSWTHIKNESMRRDVAWEASGMDERLDRGKGPVDLDWAFRLHDVLGLTWCWFPPAITLAIDARFFCASMPWGGMGERLQGRWSYQDGLEYNKRRVAEGGSAALNPWSMSELAERLRGWREGGVVDVEGLEKSDPDYWGGEMWPDTP